MDTFSKEDIAHILDDFHLYSGNIEKFSEVSGPVPYNYAISGIASTAMDDFRFSVSPMFCDEDCWVIELTDPVASLREGHRMITRFEVPKLHKHPELRQKYEAANFVYWQYNSRSDMSEAKRIPEYELLLGYAGLPTYCDVTRAIIADFRSYKKARKKITAKDRRLVEKAIKDFKKKNS